MTYSKSTQKSHAVFQDYFKDLEDPRRTSKGNHLYPLEEILFLCISAVISGADNWTAIQTFGNTKLDWLRGFLPYSHGVPSHDVLGRLFSKLCPNAFNTCFMNWMSSITKLTHGEVVAIDGKRIRGSVNDSDFRSAFHVVSAFACENGVCLAQQAVDDKSNEITAIPELLELLTLKGSVVSIDAMGCQKEIASKIIEKEADYILAVKDNQKELASQIKKMFDISQIEDEHTQRDIGHGRIEFRSCHVVSNFNFFDDYKEWNSIQSVVKITSSREIKKTGKTSIEQRYYITSLPPDAEKINQQIRQHWYIENKLHWTLDVLFNEDASLKKKGYSALNFNLLTKAALTLIKRETSTKKSIPSKRLTAALSDKYRTKILNS